MGTVGPAVLVLVFGTDAKNNFALGKSRGRGWGREKFSTFSLVSPRSGGWLVGLPFSSN
jgi:hypothetical protein